MALLFNLSFGCHCDNMSLLFLVFIVLLIVTGPQNFYLFCPYVSLEVIYMMPEAVVDGSVALMWVQAETMQRKLKPKTRPRWPD